jgi:hypothetical protein
LLFGSLKPPHIFRQDTIKSYSIHFNHLLDQVTMARDKGLEELIHDELQSTPGVTNKAMFGGWAWLLWGNLLCGARYDGMLVRLGKGGEAWALATTGIEPMISRGKHMHGWIRADARAYGDVEIRRKLLSSALQFVGSLPRK